MVAARMLAAPFVMHGLWCTHRECFASVAKKTDDQVLERTDRILSSRHSAIRGDREPLREPRHHERDTFLESFALAPGSSLLVALARVSSSVRAEGQTPTRRSACRSATRRDSPPRRPRASRARSCAFRKRRRASRSRRRRCSRKSTRCRTGRAAPSTARRSASTFPPAPGQPPLARSERTDHRTGQDLGLPRSSVAVDLRSRREAACQRRARRRERSDCRRRDGRRASRRRTPRRSYVRALRSDATLSGAHRRLDARRDLLGIARDQLAAGVGVALDVTRAESQLANARAQLIVARNDRDRARLDLRRALNLPLDAPLELTDSLASLPFADATTEQAAIDVALRTRPDLRALDAQLERRAAAARGDPRDAAADGRARSATTAQIGFDQSSAEHVHVRRAGSAGRCSRADVAKAQAQEQEAMSRDIEVRRRDLRQQVAARRARRAARPRIGARAGGRGARAPAARRAGSRSRRANDSAPASPATPTSSPRRSR